MNVRFYIFIAWLIGLNLAIAPGCTRAKMQTVPDKSDGTGVVASHNGSSSENGYVDGDGIEKFSGRATSDELDILLSNSNLSCTSGEILKFDGSSWVCGSTDATSSVKIGNDTDALLRQ